MSGMVIYSGKEFHFFRTVAFIHGIINDQDIGTVL